MRFGNLSDQHTFPHSTESPPIGLHSVTCHVEARASHTPQLNSPSKRPSKNAFKIVQKELKTVEEISPILCYPLREILSG